MTLCLETRTDSLRALLGTLGPTSLPFRMEPTSSLSCIYLMIQRAWGSKSTRNSCESISRDRRINRYRFYEGTTLSDAGLRAMNRVADEVKTVVSETPSVHFTPSLVAALGFSLRRSRNSSKSTRPEPARGVVCFSSTQPTCSSCSASERKSTKTLWCLSSCASSSTTRGSCS